LELERGRQAVQQNELNSRLQKYEERHQGKVRRMRALADCQVVAQEDAWGVTKVAPLPDATRAKLHKAATDLEVWMKGFRAVHDDEKK
jgi:hypothetical protein